MLRDLGYLFLLRWIDVDLEDHSILVELMKRNVVFHCRNIIPYIQKFKKNPVTGLPLAMKDLIKLQFHKNADNEYQCPVLHKVFTEFTHIVAVKTTGNVFSYEAIRELNIKPKSWKELLTDEPFTKEDLITIQVSVALY